MAKRKLIFVFLSLLIIFGLTLLYDYRKPNCANAQVCLPSHPRIAYGRIFNLDVPGGTSCVTDTEVGGMSNTRGFSFGGDPIIALTKWKFYYRDGNQHYARGSVMITGIPTIFSFRGEYSFTWQACFHDRNNDNPWAFDFSYVVGMFEN